MGDWNTLHLFNDIKFYSEVVPDLKGNGTLLSKGFNDEFGRVFLDKRHATERIDKIIAFTNQLDSRFKAHPTLLEIETRKKSATEEYSHFITQRGKDYDAFIQKHAQEIVDLDMLLPPILFSECALFNPHLALGRRIFDGCVSSKKGTIAEQCCIDITQRETGSTFHEHGSGIINWIAHEEIKLLILDKENLSATGSDAENYFHDFLYLLQTACENNYGFLSVTNINESVISNIKNPKLTLEIDIKEKTLGNLIIYK